MWRYLQPEAGTPYSLQQTLHVSSDTCQALTSLLLLPSMSPHDHSVHRPRYMHSDPFLRGKGNARQPDNLFSVQTIIFLEMFHRHLAHQGRSLPLQALSPLPTEASLRSLSVKSRRLMSQTVLQERMMMPLRTDLRECHGLI